MFTPFRFCSSLLVAGCLFAVVPSVHAQDATAKPVAKVAGIIITEKDIELGLEEVGPALGNMDPAQARETIINAIIDSKLAVKVAEERKLGSGADYERRMKAARERVLLDMLMVDAANKVKADEIKTFYETTKARISAEEEARARHILVETEDEAKKVVVRLKKGEDFAKVAAELTKDPSGKANGGDLGYFDRERMVREFSDAAFALKVGDISAPVKSSFGWHVIKLEDKRPKAVPPFEQVQGQIKDFLGRQAQQKAMEDLRKAYPVERLDKAAAAPAPAKSK